MTTMNESRLRQRATRQLLLLIILAGVGIGPALAQTVLPNELEMREGRYFLKGSEAPYSGAVEDPGRLVGQVEDGLRVGDWKSWDEEGNLEWIFEHENGELRRRTFWYTNGTKQMENSYAGGRPDGLHTRWSRAGAKTAEATYRQGELHGVRKLWDTDGNLLQEARYEAGKLHGPLVWFFAGGEKRWETHYDNGERTGVWTQWTQKGEVFMQSEWEAGKLISRTGMHH
jgi:antitoxin component YwqK of YwqJK toxin-antitoxin module